MSNEKQPDIWDPSGAGEATYDEPTDAPEDLKEITLKAATLKREITDLEAILKIKPEQYNEVTFNILKTLDLMELDKITAHGFLFFKERRSSVVTPKTPEEKKELFKFLQDRGIFYEMASVNSQTLNSLYKNLAEEEKAKGNFDFKMPGVPEPTISIKLKLRRS